MPSTSKRQARLMAAAAADPKVARKRGIPQKVAKEFHEADKRKARRGLGGLAGALQAERKGR